MTQEKRKTAFISASGRNTGRSIAMEFAKRGCNLVLNALSNQAACEATAEAAHRITDVDILLVMGDVGQKEVVDEIAGQALSKFGTVDIVVNNVGLRPHMPFLDMTDEVWSKVLDVNLNAAYRLCRAFVPGMIDKRWGRVVNITGKNAIKGYPGRAAVSVAKHGLWGLTKSLAKELGPYGITVNAVSPGTLRTERGSTEESDRVAALAQSIPVGRIGEPDDIAALIGFLGSAEAGYVNGQMIGCNGGAET